MIGLGIVALVTRISRRAAGPAVAIALLVFAASGASTAASIASGAAMSSSLRYDMVTDATPAERQLSAEALGGPFVGPSADPSTSGLDPAVDAIWGGQQDQLRAIHDSMPAQLRSALEPAQFTTVFPEVGAFILPGGRPAVPTEIALGMDPSFQDRVTLDAGAWPQPFSSSQGVEIILSSASATAADWQIGDVRALAVVGGVPTTVQLVGTFSAIDAGDAFWAHTSSVLKPSFVQSPDGGRIVVAQAYLDPSSWPAALGFAGVAHTSVWFAMDADHLRAGSVRIVQRELRGFAGEVYRIAPETAERFDQTVVRELRFSTDVPDFLSESLARNEVADGALALLASGPIGAGLSALFLACRLFATRISSTARLLSARGADGPQVRGIAAGAIALWALPAAVLGGAAGLLVAVVPGIMPDDPGAAVGSAAAGAVVIAAIASAGTALVVAPVPLLGSAPIRRVLESIVVVAALVLVLLAGGGLAGAGSEVGSGGDPLLAPLPIAVAAVAAILTLRVLPVIVARAMSSSRRRRGVSTLLGAAGALRRSSAVSASLVAIVIGLSVALFSGSLLTTLSLGVDRAARTAVGADVAIAAPVIDSEQVAAIAGLSGVQAAVGVSAVRGVDAEIGASTERITVLVVDSAVLRSVQESVPDGLDLPDSLAVPAAADAAVPVVLSERAAELVGSSSLTVHDRAVVAVATGPSVSALVSSETWMLVDEANAESLVGARGSSDLVLVALDPGASRAAGTATIAALTSLEPAARISTPTQVSAIRSGSPLVHALQLGVRAAVIAAGLLCVAGVVMTLALGAAARVRVLAIVTALGARRSIAGALATWEIAPAAVLGVLAATVAGMAMPFVVIPRVDLRAFTGGQAEPGVVIDPLLSALIVVGFGVVVIGAVSISAVVVRRQGGAGGGRRSSRGAGESLASGEDQRTARS